VQNILGVGGGACHPFRKFFHNKSSFIKGLTTKKENF